MSKSTPGCCIWPGAYLGSFGFQQFSLCVLSCETFQGCGHCWVFLKSVAQCNLSPHWDLVLLLSTWLIVIIFFPHVLRWQCAHTINTVEEQDFHRLWSHLRELLWQLSEKFFQQFLLRLLKVFKLVASFDNNNNTMPVSAWLKSKHAVLLYALTKIMPLKV